MNSVERVKLICKERKIPISKLEKDLQFANGYIGQLKKGSFPDDRLSAIADYLGVTVDYLMTGEEKDNETPYYLDDKAREMAEEIAKNPNLHILFDAARTVSVEDLQFVVDMVNRLKKDSE